MTSKFLIYGLVDPRSGQLRYIGKSVSGLARPKSHSSEWSLQRNTNPHKCNWIRSLLREGLRYRIVVFQELLEVEGLADLEMLWISYFRSCGHPLVNATDGGPGAIGWVPSGETRKRISESKKGMKLAWIGPQTEESKRKKSIALLGLKRSPQTQEQRLRKSIAHGGRGPFKDELGNIYFSQTEAGRKLGIHDVSVGRVLKGLRTHAGGHTFIYLEQF